MMSSTSGIVLLVVYLGVCVESKLSYGCYGPPGSPCTKHTLSCAKGEVISLSDNLGVITFAKKLNTSSCEPVLQDECDTNSCCKPGDDSKPSDVMPVSEADKILIYNQCSNKESCTVTSPYKHNSDYNYLQYFYFCMLGSKVNNITDKQNTTHSRSGFLYFTGQTKPSSHLTCSCEVTSPGKINVISYFVNLSPDTCSRVKISSQNRQLVKCDHKGGALIFNKWLDQVKEAITIDFDDFSAKRTDTIWFEFGPERDKELNINCTGCIHINSGPALTPAGFKLGVVTAITIIIPLLITGRHL
ncbi:hypothetical protein SNE40_020758 [Patella caerulea]|uniref:Uncharacterized protein n=1 Tax=Patella caerulea TaxID=87958 RepID=A0AAN8P7R7_PATCE